MNLELLNPFAQDYPENFQSSIDAVANCTRFNPRGLFAGHFLAVGRSDGVVVVLDFETQGIVRWFEGHVKAVTTVCWSRNSRYLLTASRDWNAIIWDLSASSLNSKNGGTGERRDTIRFDAPITSANLHPRNSKLLVVTLAAQAQPVFVDLRNDTPFGGRYELETTSPEPEEEGEDDEEEVAKPRDISTIARFNPNGNLIYVGTSKGNINVWDVQTKQFLWSESVSNSAIKHMEFDLTGSALVINSNDRCIRVISLLPHPTEAEKLVAAMDVDEPSTSPQPAPTPPTEAEEVLPIEEEEEAEEMPHPENVPIFELSHKFQDLVNRTPWNGCGFSRDGEYIIGGAGHKASHNVYIWDRASGGLMKILEGPKDPLEDLDWHPIRPLIASVSSLGLIHIWVTKIAENWSAYAPGFEELDENVEYQEKEDEFDIEDESVLQRRKEDEQDRPVDILSIPRHRSPTPTDASPDSFAAFVGLNNNDDTDESFYPPPEIEEYYDPGLPGEVNGVAAREGVEPMNLLDDPNAYETTGRSKRRR